MPTEKDAAEAERVIGDYYNERNMPKTAKAHYELADAFDPPKLEYADGTVAWVTSGETYKQTHLCERKDGSWVSTLGQDGKVFAFVDEKYVQHVEPLRVLADDEIALPRAAFGDVTHPTDARRYAGAMELSAYPTAHSVFTAYADAREAEEATR